MDTEIYQTIEDYLLNKLNVEEKLVVEKRIAEDLEYAKAVEAFRLALKSIEQAGEYRLEERIKLLENKLDDEGFFITDEEIMDYLDKKTPEPLTRRIEARIARDQTFAQKVETLRLVDLEITRAGNEELSEKIKKEAEKLEKEGFFAPQAISTKKLAKVKSVSWYRRIAASVALLMVGLAAAYFALRSTPEKLSYAFIDPMEDVISPQLEGGFAPVVDFQDTLQMAIINFNSANYNEAERLFEIFLNETPVDPEFHTLARLYLAQSLLLQRENPERTRDLLLPLSTDNQSPYQNEAIWYLAHSYLRSDDVEAAKRLLQQLSDDENYGSLSRVLLEELE